MSTAADKKEQMIRTAVRMARGTRDRLELVRDRESKRIGIELSEAAIVRKALELGLAQMERVK